MNRLVILTLLSLAPALAAAQPDEAFLAGQRLPAQAAVYPVYQSFTLDGRTITQTSVPVAVFVPFGRRWGLSVQAAWASARGDELTPLAGVTDARAYLSYYQPVGRGSLVASLGANLPTGKQGLTRDEFTTLALLSRDEYAFRTPSLGLGAGLAPGLTFAYPVGEALVLGGGAAYQYRGAFEPLEAMPEAYTPGREILVTGGFDARLRPGLTLAADVTYTAYGADEIGGVEVFEAGDKVTAEARLAYESPSQAAHLSGHYRRRAGSRLAAVDGALVAAEKTVPDQAALVAGYDRRFGPAFEAGVLGEVRLLDETPVRVDEATVFPGAAALYGAGVRLEWTVAPALQIPVRLLYRFGDITGVEAGLGLRTRL